MWSFVLISFGSFHLRKLGQFVISMLQHGGMRELKEVSKLGLTRGGPLFQEAYVIAAVIANLNRIVQLYGHKQLRVYLVNPTTLFLLSLHPLTVLLTTSWSTGRVNDLQKLRIYPKWNQGEMVYSSVEEERKAQKSREDLIFHLG